MSLTRKRPEDRSQRWHPRRSVRLYLDEIDELLGVMGNLGDVTAETVDFGGTIGEASELKAVGVKTIDSLTLAVDAADTRTMTVALRQPVRVMVTPGDDLELAGAAQAVRSTLRAQQTRLGGILPVSASMRAISAFSVAIGMASLTSVFAGLLLSGDDFERDSDPTAPSTIWLAAGVALAFVLAGAGFALLKAHPAPASVVVLAYRSEAPTWWERNHTAFVIGLVTNAIVGALLFLLGLWLGGT